MNKKNIMYIFNDVSFGGAGQSLLDILIGIKNEVNPIVVIRSDAIVESKFVELGITYYVIDFSSDYVKPCDMNDERKTSYIKQSYEAAYKLLPIVKNEKIELIHINSSISYFAALTALIANIPYIWHIRELVKEHYGYECLNEELKQYLYKHASKLISISNYVKYNYYKKYSLETLMMYNGLDIERFKVDINKNKKFEKIFLAVGMITVEKGQWDAICATEYLIKKGYTDIKLILVGDGPSGYIWAIKKYIVKRKLDSNIFIIPFQNDLSELRKNATYAITCSQNEALGRVTVEAMLAGNIVIGARSGATTEIIGKNEERGFLYNLHDYKNLAYVMIQAMEMPDKIKIQLQEYALRYAEDTFNSKHYCENLLDLYSEVILSFKMKNNKEFLDKLDDYYASNRMCLEHIKNDCSIRFKKADTAFGILLKWWKIKQSGHCLDEYFKKNNINSIAIYGMADIGCCLYDELENSEIEIKYLIDKNPGGMENIFEFVSLGDNLFVDQIVVTVALEEKNIVNEIFMKGYERVIGLSEILNSFDEVCLLNIIV